MTLILREMEMTIDLSKDCVMFSVIDKNSIDCTTVESKIEWQKRKM